MGRKEKISYSEKSNGNYTHTNTLEVTISVKNKCGCVSRKSNFPSEKSKKLHKGTSMVCGAPFSKGFLGFLN